MRFSFFLWEIFCEKYGRSHDLDFLITVTYVQNVVVSGNNHGGLEIDSAGENLIVPWINTDRRKVRNAIDESHYTMCD